MIFCLFPARIAAIFLQDFPRRTRWGGGGGGGGGAAAPLEFFK